jgi:hypothetical protein
MIEKVKKISNPLTIIAIFAALAEVGGTSVISFLNPDLQPIFMWFLVLFPTLLVTLFFLTLNFNPRVIYAPSDFRNEVNFLKTLGGNYLDYHFEVNQDNLARIKEQVKKNGFKEQTQNLEEGVMVDLANTFFDHFLSLIGENLEEKHLKLVSFAIHSPNYYLLRLKLKQREIKKQAPNELITIINIQRNTNNEAQLVAIGKNIIAKEPKNFANKMYELVMTEIEQSKN